MELLSVLGSHAFFLFLIGAGFFIAIRTTPGEADE